MTDTTTNRIINIEAITNELMNQLINSSVDKVRGLYFSNEIDGQQFLLQLLNKVQQSLAMNVLNLVDKINELKTTQSTITKSEETK